MRAINPATEQLIRDYPEHGDAEIEARLRFRASLRAHRVGRIMLPIHTILHPTDFSECSQCAFGTACALARDYGARLIVLHMIPVGTPEILNLVQLGGESTESIRESVRSSLQRVQAPHPVIQVEHRLEDGDPAKGILRVAEESHAHLIVMGTKGRTGVARLLMGSVAEQVQRRATCPVLVVKAPSPARV